MFDSDGKCICSLCGADAACVLTREGLLRKTSEYGSTAVNMAVVSGSPKMVLLLNWAIDMCKKRDLLVENSCMEPQEFYRNWCLEQERKRSLEEKSGSGGEVPKEILANDVGVHMEVPDVKDEAIGRNIYGTDVIDDLILKVYELIEKKLNENWGDDQEVMDMLKGICKEHVDVEFVPIAHIFLHFLGYMYLYSSHRKFRKKFLKEIVVACNKHDHSEGGNNESMLVTLFNILDPRGRTILHATFECDVEFLTLIFEILKEIEEKVPLSRIEECVNAKDGAGRTILHLACINDFISFVSRDTYSWMKGKLSSGLTMSPRCHQELNSLRMWCFPQYCRVQSDDCEPRPVHLAVVFNSPFVLEYLLTAGGVDGYLNAPFNGTFFIHSCILRKRRNCGPFLKASQENQIYRRPRSWPTHQ